MTDDKFEFYKKQYEQMHEKGYFRGGSLRGDYVEPIKLLVEKTKSVTVLDFGCGKASAYKVEPPINEKFGIKSENMKFYDIGVKEYQTLLEGEVDGIICTDVLEHIPEELIDSTLNIIFSKATKFVFLVIHCGLAAKILPNGENAHSTVKEPDWWNKKIHKFFTDDILVHLKYEIPKDPKLNILNL